MAIFPFIALQMAVLAKYTLKGKANLALNSIIGGFRNKIIPPKEVFDRYS